MKTINFKSGKIIYNEFHINFDLPYSEQKYSLNEDLLQVEYANGYIIDLGWYPENDESGMFILQLIKNGNWRKPIYKKKSKDWAKVKKVMIKAIEALETGDTRGLNAHPLSGNRSGQYAIDIKGTGRGRGKGRIYAKKE